MFSVKLSNIGTGRHKIINLPSFYAPAIRLNLGERSTKKILPDFIYEPWNYSTLFADIFTLIAPRTRLGLCWELLLDPSSHITLGLSRLLIGQLWIIQTSDWLKTDPSDADFWDPRRGSGAGLDRVKVSADWESDVASLWRLITIIYRLPNCN